MPTPLTPLPLFLRRPNGNKKYARTFWINAEAKGLKLCWDSKRPDKGKTPQETWEVLDAKEPQQKLRKREEEIIQVGALRILTAEEWFNIADMDDSGTMDASELAWVYSKARDTVLDDNQVQKAMRLLDISGDGKVDIHEFSVWWEMEAMKGTIEAERQNAMTVVCQGGARLHLVPVVPKPSDTVPKMDKAQKDEYKQNITKAWMAELTDRGATRVLSTQERTAKQKADNKSGKSQQAADRRSQRIAAKRHKAATKFASMRKGNRDRKMMAARRTENAAAAKKTEEAVANVANEFTSSGVFKTMCKDTFAACAESAGKTGNKVVHRKKLQECMRTLHRKQYCLTIRFSTPDADAVSKVADSILLDGMNVLNERMFIQLATMLCVDVEQRMKAELSVLAVVLLVVAMATHGLTGPFFIVGLAVVLSQIVPQLNWCLTGDLTLGRGEKADSATLQILGMVLVGACGLVGGVTVGVAMDAVEASSSLDFIAVSGILPYFYLAGLAAVVGVIRRTLGVDPRQAALDARAAELAEQLVLKESDDNDEMSPEDRQAALEARAAELKNYLLLKESDDDDDNMSPDDRQTALEARAAELEKELLLVDVRTRTPHHNRILQGLS